VSKTKNKKPKSQGTPLMPTPSTGNLSHASVEKDFFRLEIGLMGSFSFDQRYGAASFLRVVDTKTLRVLAYLDSDGRKMKC
jgi:hypothetical protein